MHKMSITYSKNAAKYINKLDKPTKLLTKSAIEGLPDGDVKYLKT